MLNSISPSSNKMLNIKLPPISKNNPVKKVANINNTKIPSSSLKKSDYIRHFDAIYPSSLLKKKTNNDSSLKKQLIKTSSTNKPTSKIPLAPSLSKSTSNLPQIFPPVVPRNTKLPNIPTHK